MGLERFDLRKTVQGQLREGDTIRAYRVVHYLWRIQVQQWRPRDGIEALEEEHHSYVAVDQGF